MGVDPVPWARAQIPFTLSYLDQRSLLEADTAADADYGT
jgi:hypothetical protein